MDTIKITVEVNGNAISREFGGVGTKAWNGIIEDMLKTLEESKETKF